MDPQQELFTMLKLEIEKYGYKVYDAGLPPKGTPYPFIYMSDSDLREEPNKSAIFGRVTQRVDIWHDDPEKRGTLSAIMLNVKRAARAVENGGGNFGWTLLPTHQRILKDDTAGTSRPLLHGVLEFEYKFG